MSRYISTVNDTQTAPASSELKLRGQPFFAGVSNYQGWNRQRWLVQQSTIDPGLILVPRSKVHHACHLQFRKMKRRKGLGSMNCFLSKGLASRSSAATSLDNTIFNVSQSCLHRKNGNTDSAPPAYTINSLPKGMIVSIAKQSGPLPQQAMEHYRHLLRLIILICRIREGCKLPAFW